MRRSFPLLLLAPLACLSTAPFSAQRVEDGSLQLRCRTALADCLAHFDDVCQGSVYEVITAHDERRPVDVAVGSYQRQTRFSDARIRCGRSTAQSLPPASDGGAPRAPSPRACVPGSTQACVGAGACAGGQSCLADGAGFGPCDCGVTARPADGGAQ